MTLHVPGPDLYSGNLDIEGEILSAEAPGFMHRDQQMPFREAFFSLQNRSSRSPRNMPGATLGLVLMS